MNALNQTFRSLRVRNYRLYFTGQLVSLSGTWMQGAALAWLVLELTGSGTALGLVVAAQFLPTLLLGPWGGLVADRFDKRRTLILAQSGMAAVAGTLALLCVTGAVQLWMVYALAVALGLGNVIDNPVRQAFVTEMVRREDLQNAVGLSSAMFNAARIVGPALAALIISSAGERVTLGTGLCFAVNAFSFLAVLAGLALMRPSELTRTPPAPRAKGQIRAGLSYALGEPKLRAVLGLMALVGLFGMNFQVVLPILAKESFAGGAGSYGALSVAMGLGSLTGSLGAAFRPGPPTMRLLAVAAGAFGVLSVAAAAAPTLTVALVLLFTVGASVMTLFAAANTTVQLTARPELRGRVMALYLLLIMGSTPIGGPVIGWICQNVGPRYGLGLGGLAGIAGAVLIAGAARRQAAAEARAVGAVTGDGDPAGGYGAPSCARPNTAIT